MPTDGIFGFLFQDPQVQPVEVEISPGEEKSSSEVRKFWLWEVEEMVLYVLLSLRLGKALLLLAHRAIRILLGHRKFRI